MVLVGGFCWWVYLVGLFCRLVVFAYLYLVVCFGFCWLVICGGLCWWVILVV